MILVLSYISLLFITLLMIIYIYGKVFDILGCFISKYRPATSFHTLITATLRFHTMHALILWRTPHYIFISSRFRLHTLISNFHTQGAFHWEIFVMLLIYHFLRVSFDILPLVLSDMYHASLSLIACLAWLYYIHTLLRFISYYHCKIPPLHHFNKI